MVEELNKHTLETMHGYTQRQQQESSLELPVLLSTTLILPTFGDLWAVLEQ